MATIAVPRTITGWRVWVMAARPATLPASVAPVLVGTAVGVHDGAFALLPFVGALLAAVLIQIGANLANDLFDFEKGADTSDRLGPPRVTQSGLASPQQVRVAMMVSFGAAVLIGCYLMTVGGWPILVIGVLCIAAGIAYTGGPWPLGYHGLGDLFVFIFFGLVAVTGSAYLQTGVLSRTALAAALPVGCPVTALLVINNLRDIATDQRVGKRTLAVRLGASLTRMQYTLLLVLPYLLVTGFVLRGIFPQMCWLVWLTSPLAVSLIRTVVNGAEGRTLNDVLKGTGKLHLFFGLTLAGGLFL
jgi:1,4-dihydroxy-2-naphthoate octaprenyltransferase